MPIGVSVPSYFSLEGSNAMYGMNTGGMYPGTVPPDPSAYQYPPPSFSQRGLGQNQPVQPQEAPFDGLTRVTGMQGAKLYKMPENSRIALFDDTDDIVIIKSTDGAGFASYRRARLEWLPDEPEGEYVTHEELRKQFEELKGLILNNGKQSVRKSGKNAAGDDGE